MRGAECRLPLADETHCSVKGRRPRGFDRREREGVGHCAFLVAHRRERRRTIYIAHICSSGLLGRLGHVPLIMSSRRTRLGLTLFEETWGGAPPNWRCGSALPIPWTAADLRQHDQCLKGCICDPLQFAHLVRDDWSAALRRVVVPQERCVLASGRMGPGPCCVAAALAECAER